MLDITTHEEASVQVHYWYRGEDADYAVQVAYTIPSPSIGKIKPPHASPPAPPRTRPCPYWELSPAAPARQRLARSVDRRQAVRRPRREPRRAAKVQACHGARQKGWCKGLGLSLARRRLGQTSGRLQPPSTGGGALTLRGENADVHREARRKLAHYWRGDAIIADHNIAKIGGGRSTRPVALLLTLPPLCRAAEG